MRGESEKAPELKGREGSAVKKKRGRPGLYHYRKGEVNGSAKELRVGRLKKTG